MLSINMRVFKTVLLIAFFASVQCLPVIDKSTESEIDSKIEIKDEIISVIPQETAVTFAAPTSTLSDAIDYYDQRQNGTENYRIHLDGLVFVFAPVEALLLAGATGNSEHNLSISNQKVSTPPTIQSINELDKPIIDSVPNKTDLAISKTLNKPAVLLMNFLSPLIRRIRHVRGTSVH
ncbi:hypothetical protein ALC53_00579 [Atta colombica]|uniref:Uncharacterized protein n=1 Tax=Atta colombica TaxID=520822 RepID=A0A195BXL8_9HYME|nr:PREDICTED: uncharacterized protein LOC108685646 [Atta colombica]KYM93040.1 hypothetical protein ALC53_00579 [Atta colombica]